MSVTALSGQDLSRMGAGEVIPLATLDAAGQKQILDAEQMAVSPSVYKLYFGSINDATQLGIYCVPQFSLSFQWSAANGTQSIDIPLHDHELALGSKPLPVGTHASPEPASAPDPPSLASLMAQEPSAQDAQPAWLGQEALQLLAPIATARLALAPDVPFSSAAFLQTGWTTVATLSSAQQTWLQAVYAQRQTKDQADQATLNRLKAAGNWDGSRKPNTVEVFGPDQPGERPTIVEPANVPVIPLPAWGDLQNTQVSLHSNFNIMLCSMDGTRVFNGQLSAYGFGRTNSSPLAP